LEKVWRERQRGETYPLQVAQLDAEQEEQELEEVDEAGLAEAPEEWSANEEMSLRTRLLLQEGHGGCGVEEERISCS
jgi:hypothetical protein